MNAWLDVRCRTLWSEIEHPDYTGVTIAEALEHEQIYLMPMPTPFDGYVEVVARVSSTCLVTVARNQYSVPCHLANSKATIHLYADMPLPFAQLQTALRHRERQQGDRIMTKVLAAVPTHGLETVLLAVKQVLDSGVTSIEQVRNVLSRLNDLPVPEQVETSLKLTEEPLEPLADTARYDSLHDREVAHV